MFWETFVGLCKSVNEKPNPVADKLNISSGTVTNWKRGTLPNTEALIKLSDYFEVPIDYLLGRTDNPNSFYVNGDNSVQVNGNNGNHSPLTINNSEQPKRDKLKEDFMKLFDTLDFNDKIEVMQFAVNKTKNNC